MEKRRLCVGGLPRLEPQSAAQDFIKQIFCKFEIEAISKIISPRDIDRNRHGNAYYAFVDLPTEAEAQTAIRALDNLRTEFGFLRVRMADPGPGSKVVREQMMDRVVEV